jgi:glycosyltransferase involved in cell wall biosynthesis
MHPKVSIQIPTYNQKGFILKAIESCLMQDYPNLEINIADDQSTDDTYKLIEPFLIDKRIKYYRNETNIGMVANYHKALYEYATGDWAINLDGDDYFTDKSFISTAIEIIRSLNDEKIIVYQGNHDINRIIKAIPACERINEDSILVEGPAYFLNYYKVLNFNHCATMYKRSEALKLNFYSFNCLFTDFNSVAKLFVTGRVLLSQKKVAVWYQHESNKSATLDGKKIKDELAAINELAEFAALYLPSKPVQKWRIKMKGYFLSIYVDLQTTATQHRVAVKQLIFDFHVDAVYFRQLAKAALGSVGIQFKKRQKLN